MTNRTQADEALEPRPETPAQQVPVKLEWWLLTGGDIAAPSSRLYSGPYSTREDAFVARVMIERLRGANDLWVDSRPVRENSHD